MERWLFELVQDLYPTSAGTVDESTQMRTRAAIAG
jgi:hypothetical protein